MQKGAIIMNSSCLRGGVNELRVSIREAINIQFFHTLNMRKTISRSLFLLEEENKRRSWNVGPIERRKESRSWVFNCLNIIIWISRHVPPISPFLQKNPKGEPSNNFPQPRLKCCSWEIVLSQRWFGFVLLLTSFYANDFELFQTLHLLYLDLPQLFSLWAL